MNELKVNFPSHAISGTFHAYLAFDWGEEVNLEKAKRLVPAVVHSLPRRRRTPASIDYRPQPLRFLLGAIPLELPELGTVQARAEATVFEFGGVSVALHLPFRLSAEAMTRLAGWLADPSLLVQTARMAVAPLYHNLFPAIQNPAWGDDLSEEYFVFQIPPGDSLTPERLREENAAWLSSLLRLEAGALSRDEIAEALRLQLSYGPEDLIITDWGVTVLLDHDCDETLETIEFTNLQLLEYRHIDLRLDVAVTTAYGFLRKTARSWLPFWQTFTRPLRTLGELKVEANEMFERTDNVFKLIGDQYLARVYSLLATRFHLVEWEKAIERKLSILEGVYQVLSDQASTYRSELLEAIIIILIVAEIAMAIFHWP